MSDEVKLDNIKKISESRDSLISIATMSIGEGADLIGVDAVILSSGGKGSIRLLQRIGRGMRLFPEKKEVLVFDFQDWFHPSVLLRHSNDRARIFKNSYKE